VQLNLSKFSIKECRHGVMVWPKADRVIGAALASYGEFAEGENRVMARYLKPGDVSVDIGANVGTTTLPMSRAVAAYGQVLAFEPQPLVAHCLATSLVLNEISNVRLLSLAVSQSAGFARMDFNAGGDAGNFGSAALSAEGDLVPTIALDDLQIDRVALLKIDVEGHEWDVFQGAERTIRSCLPVIYFEAKRLEGTVSSIDYLQKHGYRCYWHFANFFRADNFLGNADDMFRGVGDMNILAVPTERQQPDDLPEIHLADEDWRTVYTEFFSTRGLVMP
jgi:FkbM family methyltransferase